MRAVLTTALAALLAAPAAAQVYPMCPGGSQGQPCRVWYGTATTVAGGGWSIAFPDGTFTAPPKVSAQAVSTTTALAASAQATVTARSASGASGLVTLPATLVVGGLPVMAAGAGISVDVVAVGP